MGIGSLCQTNAHGATSIEHLQVAPEALEQFQVGYALPFVLDSPVFSKLNEGAL
jgi:hypothetical protein